MLRWSHRSFGFTVFGCLAALTAACSAARHPIYDDPNVLFQDDFTDPSTGWDVHTDSLITTTYDSRSGTAPCVPSGWSGARGTCPAANRSL